MKKLLIVLAAIAALGVGMVGCNKKEEAKPAAKTDVKKDEKKADDAKGSDAKDPDAKDSDAKGSDAKTE